MISVRGGKHWVGALAWTLGFACGDAGESAGGGGSGVSVTGGAGAGTSTGGAGSRATVAGASASASAGTAGPTTTPQPAAAGQAGGNAGHGDTSAAGSGGVATPAAGSGGSAGGGSAGPASLGLGKSGQNGSLLSAAIVMSDIQPGEESHECVVVELPNAAPIWVNALHGTLSGGSHHLIVDRRPTDSVLQLEAATCSPTMAGDDTRLLIAQQHDTKLTLPKGVAYHLDAHQRIFLQLHYINSGDKPLEIEGKIELTPAPENTQPIEAQSWFTGPLNIQIPAGQATSIKHFQPPNAGAQGARHVFALTSHTHKLGVRATIERVPSADAPDSKLLHESLDWAEPPLSVFDTPLLFDGEDGLRLTCYYENTSTRTVTFGTSANDEMCFMWLYYYDE